MMQVLLTDAKVASDAELYESVEEAVEKTSMAMEMLRKFIDNYAVPFVITLLVACICYAVGRKLIKWCMKLVEKSFVRAEMEVSAARFLCSVIRAVLHVLLIFVVAGILGVGTSSIVAIVGSCGLAVGLALQGSLSNFAGGVLLLLLKPFVVEDYIIVDGCEGKVLSIDIIYTRLLTKDNCCIVIPNGTLANSNITNVTANARRRLDLEISIAYEEDVKRVRHILLSVIEGQEMIIKEEPAQIFVSGFAASAITMEIRVWVATEDYQEARWRLLEAVKEAFDRDGVVIPYDQLDINMKQ